MKALRTLGLALLLLAGSRMLAPAKLWPSSPISGYDLMVTLDGTNLDGVVVFQKDYLASALAWPPSSRMFFAADAQQGMINLYLANSVSGPWIRFRNFGYQEKPQTSYRARVWLKAKYKI